MKYEFTPSFETDLRRLRPEHLREFRAVVAERFAPACDAFVAQPRTKWPASLRVKPVVGTRGILEMTWSFTSPDGRATFEFVTVGSELVCGWRRVGGHGVFADP